MKWIKIQATSNNYGYLKYLISKIYHQLRWSSAAKGASPSARTTPATSPAPNNWRRDDRNSHRQPNHQLREKASRLLQSEDILNVNRLVLFHRTIYDMKILHSSNHCHLFFQLLLQWHNCFLYIAFEHALQSFDSPVFQAPQPFAISRVQKKLAVLSVNFIVSLECTLIRPPRPPVPMVTEIFRMDSLII